MAERKVDVLVVRWYEHRATSPDVVGRWLRAAEEFLPEAVPMRFGETEPLRGRGDLGAAFAEATSLLFLAGRPPVYHGSLSAGGPGPVAVHGLNAVLEPDDERVTRFAEAMMCPGTFYASMSVERGETLDGNTLWGPGENTQEPYLAPRGDWLGLPPAPPLRWWFGPAYQRLVKGHKGPWVPANLRARLDEIDPADRHARKMPRGLRRSPWRLLLGRS